MINRNDRYEYLLTIYNKKGDNVSSSMFSSKSKEDTINWRLNELIDRTKYDFNIVYLGVRGRTRRLKKLEPTNI